MRREVVAGWALAMSGCSAIFGLDSPSLTDGGVTDVAPDAPPVCVGVGNYQVCLANVPDRLDYANTTIITDQQCAFYDSSNPTWCIYAARHVKITGTLRATGASPFVLIATDEMTITETGVVDVASHASMTPGAGIGAGGDVVSCIPAGTGGADPNGGGGGAGATYGTRGGKGGDGVKPGGASVQVNIQETLATFLRGGCRGGAGGAGSTASDVGGAGGGALYLAAKTTMTISGAVNASGAGGGKGNAAKGGGSGGGSGGTIVLWAGSSLAVTGNVFANGGGGGGGSDNGAAGSVGGESTAADGQAAGGYGGGTTACGTGPGCGGAGAAKGGDGQDGFNDTTTAGGGGGGGGLGVIRILSGQMPGGSFSPAPLRN
jgi:hypothetical protein